MLRRLSACLLVVSVCFVGCNAPEETIPAITPTSGVEESNGTTTSGTTTSGSTTSGWTMSSGTTMSSGITFSSQEDTEKPATGRFVADKSLNVPGMACPYACWPHVQKTLAALPGVEGVQLAVQPNGTPEGTIEKKVVEIKITAEFDAEDALAVLEKEKFPAEYVN